MGTPSPRCYAAVAEVQRLVSHGTTAAFQARVFVTVTNGAPACVRVCVYDNYVIIGSESCNFSSFF